MRLRRRRKWGVVPRRSSIRSCSIRFWATLASRATHTTPLLHMLNIHITAHAIAHKFAMFDKQIKNQEIGIVYMYHAGMLWWVQANNRPDRFLDVVLMRAEQLLRMSARRLELMYLRKVTTT